MEEYALSVEHHKNTTLTSLMCAYIHTSQNTNREHPIYNLGGIKGGGVNIYIASVKFNVSRLSMSCSYIAVLLIISDKLKKKMLKWF